MGTWRRRPTPDLCSTRTPPTTAPEAGCHCGRTSLRVPLAPEARAVGGSPTRSAPRQAGWVLRERWLCNYRAACKTLPVTCLSRKPAQGLGGPLVRFSGPSAGGPGSTPRQRTGSHAPQLRVHRPPEDRSAHVLQRHSQVHK